MRKTELQSYWRGLCDNLTLPRICHRFLSGLPDQLTHQESAQAFSHPERLFLTPPATSHAAVQASLSSCAQLLLFHPLIHMSWSVCLPHQPDWQTSLVLLIFQSLTQCLHVTHSVNTWVIGWICQRKGGKTFHTEPGMARGMFRNDEKSPRIRA